mgnify:CR=1 FL=1
MSYIQSMSVCSHDDNHVINNKLVFTSFYVTLTDNICIIPSREAHDPVFGGVPPAFRQ